MVTAALQAFPVGSESRSRAVAVATSENPEELGLVRLTVSCLDSLGASAGNPHRTTLPPRQDRNGGRIRARPRATRRLSTSPVAVSVPSFSTATRILGRSRLP
jgi:hypothetical protein